MSRGLFWYLGTDDIKFEAGVASESMITSQAHSIVVLRFADEKQAADAAAKLKTTVDPRKWICVAWMSQGCLQGQAGLRCDGRRKRRLLHQ